MLDRLCKPSAADLGYITHNKLPSNLPALQNRQEKVKREQLRRERTGEEAFVDHSPSSTTIEAHPLRDFILNPFLSVFTAIRDLRSRQLAEKYQDLKNFSLKMSTQAHENKSEQSSEELLHRLMEIIQLLSQDAGEDWLRR